MRLQRNIETVKLNLILQVCGFRKTRIDKYFVHACCGYVNVLVSCFRFWSGCCWLDIRSLSSSSRLRCAVMRVWVEIGRNELKKCFNITNTEHHMKIEIVWISSVVCVDIYVHAIYLWCGVVIPLNESPFRYTT